MSLSCTLWFSRALAPALLLGSAFAQAPMDAFEAEALQHYEWTGPLSDIERAIGSELRQSRRADDSAKRGIVARLAGLGTPAIPGLFEVLVQARVPKAGPQDAPQALSGPQRTLILDTIARLPAADVRTELAARLGPVPEPPACLVAVEVLGAIGNESDLARLAQLLPREESGALSRASRTVLRPAYAGILRRDPRAYERARGLLRELDADATQEILTALADVGDSRGLAILFEAARSRPALGRTPVALVPRLAPSNDVGLALEFAAWLRQQIDPAQPEWTRAVFAALGALDEGAAIPELLIALEDPERPVRESALDALRRISGLYLPADRQRWQVWYDAESKWLDKARGDRIARLRGASAAQVVEMLRTYGHHRLFKSELAAELVPFLEHADPAVRALTCETMGRLGSRAALRELLPLLDDPVALVSTAARRALETILGHAVPAGSAAAQELVFPGS